jgi:thiamine biosynthesis protein ThiI
MARQIGTYETSILADQDCCSLFIPKHPETMSSMKQAESAEANLDITKLVQSALDGTTSEVILPEY